MDHGWRVELIRPSDEADIAAVAALEAASFTNPWTREMLTRELADSPVARVYVLRLPDLPVAAFCSCWVVAGELHVNTLAVRHDLRRSGFGLALMRRVLELVEAEEVAQATLEVRRSNGPALRLYEKLGFRRVAIRPRYYTHPEEDAVILWRDAAAPKPP